MTFAALERRFDVVAAETDPYSEHSQMLRDLCLKRWPDKRGAQGATAH